MSQIPIIQLYSRHNCDCCDEAEDILRTLEEQGVCDWQTIAVDHDKALLVRYGEHVPVLLLDGVEISRHHFNMSALAAAISAYQIKKTGTAICP
ncbi:MAG: glutaredoxin family protein [Mariprofundales bacterium]